MSTPPIGQRFADRHVSPRRRGGEETRGVPVAQLVDGIATEIAERHVEPKL